MKTAFLDLTTISQTAANQLDPASKRLYQIQKMGLPVAPTLLISPTTLNFLFHNKPSTKKELLNKYHSFLNNDFVCLYYSTKDNDVLKVDNIKGDANLLETLNESATHIHDKQVLVQATPQPSFSGLAFTSNQSNNEKRQIELQFMQGTFNEADTTNHQRIAVDVRTLNPVKSITTQTQQWKKTLDGLEPHKLQAKNHQAITPAILTRLSKHIIAIKQKFFKDQVIYWSVIDKQIQIHFVEDAVQDSDFEQAGELLSLGTSLIPGFVQGRSFFINKNKKIQSANRQTGSILVAEKLSSKDIEAIKQANGIIVEQSLMDHQVLGILKKYTIPTVVHAQFATNNIAPNQELLLDAGAGRIYASDEKSTQLTQHHKDLQIGLIGGDPRLYSDQVQSQADNFLLSANSFYAALGKHPLSLNTKESKEIISQLVSIFKHCDQSFKNWKYLPLSLASDFRKNLKGGILQETLLETNPSLGNRGLSYLLEHIQLLKLEIEAADFFIDHTSNKIKFTLPYVSSWQDILLFSKIVPIKKNSEKLEIWAHLASFASYNELLSQPNQKLIKGVILDLDYLAAAWFGSDPQKSVSEKQLLEADSFWKIIDQTRVENNIPIEIVSRYTTKNSAQKIKDHGFTNIITTANHLAAARMVQS